MVTWHVSYWLEPTRWNWLSRSAVYSSLLLLPHLGDRENEHPIPTSAEPDLLLVRAHWETGYKNTLERNSDVHPRRAVLIRILCMCAEDRDHQEGLPQRSSRSGRGRGPRGGARNRNSQDGTPAEAGVRRHTKIPASLLGCP